MKNNNLKVKVVSTLLNLAKTEALMNVSHFNEGETMVLVMLSKISSPVAPSTISDILSISRARMTKIINSLVNKDLISINRNEEDRRRLEINITDNGKNYVKTKKAKIEGYFDALYDQLGEEKILSALEIIETATGILKKIEKEVFIDE